VSVAWPWLMSALRAWACGAAASQLLHSRQPAAR
jgi:hypothetical protein